MTSLLATQVSCLVESLRQDKPQRLGSRELRAQRKANILAALDEAVGATYEQIAAELDIPHDEVGRIVNDLVKEGSASRAIVRVAYVKRRRANNGMV